MSQSLEEIYNLLLSPNRSDEKFDRKVAKMEPTPSCGLQLDLHTTT